MAFNVRKAAQVVAFFVSAEGGRASVIKTVKLVYLADRRFLERYDLPILGDQLVSMQHGPVNSRTYDFIKRQECVPDVWAEYISPRDGNNIRLAKEVKPADLNELNRAELKTLKETYDIYRNFDPFGLVDYVHESCAEWEDVGNTSRPLSYERVFSALGKRNSRELEEHVKEHARIADITDR